MRFRLIPILGLITLVSVLAFTLSAPADDAPAADEASEKKADAQPKPVRLGTAPLWIDKAKNRVFMVGKVCLREGQLEMFACPEGTKEHESVLSVPVEAYKVHAALLAIGVEPGQPVQFQPSYHAATGPIIDVALYWTDEKGQRRSAWAQNWVQDASTGKALAEPWVFGGSLYWVDEETGRRDYLANHGELICVSNFSSAMLDLPIESSDKAGQLLFTAYTERIPPVNTKVTVVLKPREAVGQPEGEQAVPDAPKNEERE